MVRLELVQLNHRSGLAGVHVAGPCGAIGYGMKCSSAPLLMIDRKEFMIANLGDSVRS